MSKKVNSNEIHKKVSDIFEKKKNSEKGYKENLKSLKIDHINEIQLKDNQKCYLIQISSKNLTSFKKVHSLLSKTLEEYLSNTVLLIPSRKKIKEKQYNKNFFSKKYGKDNTLNSVFDSYLEDILYPATIIGKRIRYPLEKTTVIVDPLYKETINYKLDAIKACFKLLTNYKLNIEF